MVNSVSGDETFNWRKTFEWFLPLKMAERPWKKMHAPVIDCHRVLKNQSLLFVIQFMATEEWQFMELQHKLAFRMAHAR
jgi:hypothetical protein